MTGNVRKNGVNRYTLVKGATPQFPDLCDGTIHPERKDDFAWENDRGAYRVYGPALEATGERSFGIDVWTKNTPDPVVNDRYYIEDVVMMPKVDSFEGLTVIVATRSIASTLTIMITVRDLIRIRLGRHWVAGRQP